jgi:Tol biopolymer transport system component
MMPILGGKPQVAADVFAYYPVVSPDGKSFAFVTVNEQNRPLIAICLLSDCSTPRTVAVPRGPTALQWTPDGKGVAFSMLSNIWVQPRDGAAAYPLTKFAEDDFRIEDFEWSRDGKRLAFSRSKTAWDVVLFRGVTRD